METNLGGLSFIVPVFNEQDAITETIINLRNVLAELKMPSEIIIVDDGSTDGTKQAIELIDFPNLILLQHPTNSGYGAAIKTGIRASQFGWIGTVDADGSYEIGAIPRLVNKATQGFDMVVGNRTDLFDHDSVVKRLFRGIFFGLVGFLVDKKIEDINSGFRLVRKSAVMEFFPFLCPTFSLSTSLTVFFAERGLFVISIPTEYYHRKGKSKVRHWRDSLRAIQMVLQGITYFNPLKVFLIISILLGLFTCIPAMVLALFGMMTLSAYFLIFGCVMSLLFGLGILGDIIRISAIRMESATRISSALTEDRARHSEK
jgi:polyisoprenyl-phosphate glycosyltransferase